jgi:hypothetical protein
MALRALQTKTKDMRIDQTAQQVQQIMQASVAYYVDNGQWPGANSIDPLDFNEDGIAELIQNNYLPEQTNGSTEFKNSLGNAYETSILLTPDNQGNSTKGLFQISSNMNIPAYANTLKGLLPLSKISTDDNNTVITSVTIPGYNYNNAQSIKNAGIYNYGDCVPEPQCPDDMKPRAFMSPAGIVGLAGTDTSVSYNLQSFLALAYGDDPNKDNNPTTTPAQCPIQIGPKTCPEKSWRACLKGTTERGAISATIDSKGQGSIQIMAVTQCVFKSSNTPNSHTDGL